jgi:hypothetical protein
VVFDRRRLAAKPISRNFGRLTRPAIRLPFGCLRRRRSPRPMTGSSWPRSHSRLRPPRPGARRRFARRRSAAAARTIRATPTRHPTAGVMTTARGMTTVCALRSNSGPIRAAGGGDIADWELSPSLWRLGAGGVAMDRYTFSWAPAATMAATVLAAVGILPYFIELKQTLYRPLGDWTEDITVGLGTTTTNHRAQDTLTADERALVDPIPLAF